MSNISLFGDSENYVSFATGQLIFEQGQSGKFMFVIKEGAVEMQIKGKAISTLGVGESFGEVSLIIDSPRSATAIAKTDCKLVMIDQKYFDFLVQNTPDFANNIMQIVTHRLLKADERA